MALILLTVTGTGMGQTNWPSFRGLEAKGVAPDAITPITWNVETSENILWKTPIPGLAHSSPIVWGRRLLVTTAINERKISPLKVGLYGAPESADDNDRQQWKVYCLDKITGNINWQSVAYEGIPHGKRHPKGTHANCTMATDGTNVVAFFGSEGLYCYDLDGRLRWKNNLGVLRASPSAYNDAVDTNGWTLEWGFASSPIILPHPTSLCFAS